MAQIALAQKPLQVAVACIADILAVQRGMLVSVALGVRLVALLAMVAIDKRPGRYRIRLPGQRIGQSMVSRRHSHPMGAGSRAMAAATLKAIIRTANMDRIIRTLHLRSETSGQPDRIRMPNRCGRPWRGLCQLIQNQVKSSFARPWAIASR